MKTKVLTLRRKGVWTRQEQRTKAHCLFANPTVPSFYLFKQLQDMDFVLVVVEELEHFKVHWVVNYRGRKGNSLTPHKVPGYTQGCSNSTACCHCFRETARNACLGTAQACWKHGRMQWTEMCLSKILEGSDC